MPLSQEFPEYAMERVSVESVAVKMPESMPPYSHPAPPNFATAVPSGEVAVCVW